MKFDCTCQVSLRFFLPIFQHNKTKTIELKDATDKHLHVCPSDLITGLIFPKLFGSLAASYLCLLDCSWRTNWCHPPWWKEEVHDMSQTPKMSQPFPRSFSRTTQKAMCKSFRWMCIILQYVCLISLALIWFLVLFPVYAHHEKECTPSWTFVHLAPKSRESQRPPCQSGRNRGMFTFTSRCVLDECVRTGVFSRGHSKGDTLDLRSK